MLALLLTGCSNLRWKILDSGACHKEDLMGRGGKWNEKKELYKIIKQEEK